MHKRFGKLNRKFIYYAQLVTRLLSIVKTVINKILNSTTTRVLACKHRGGVMTYGLWNTFFYKVQIKEISPYCHKLPTIIVFNTKQQMSGQVSNF